MKQRRWWRPAVLVGAVLLVGACGNGDETAEQPTPGVATPEEAVTDEITVSFAEPADGDTVTSPVQVQMQSTGILVGPVAEAREDTGHFHVMIDVGCVPAGEEIPSDDQHLHFGDGASRAEVELEPGEHTLCLQAGDNEHIAFDATDEITVTVE